MIKRQRGRIRGTGTGVIEYVLLLMVVAVVVVLCMRHISTGMHTTVNTVSTRMEDNNVLASAPAAPER
jgi:Flp pilus assembly pilin Flp